MSNTYYEVRFTVSKLEYNEQNTTTTTDIDAKEQFEKLEDAIAFANEVVRMSYDFYDEKSKKLCKKYGGDFICSESETRIFKLDETEVVW